MTTKSYIVTKDKAQTLTQKTIDADSNVIQNLEVGNLKATAVSKSIPSSGAVDTKLVTEKAVGDFGLSKVNKQWTSAEDNYIAIVDPIDHILKPMVNTATSCIVVVTSLPASGVANTLYIVLQKATILHKYAVEASYSFDYELTPAGLYDNNTGTVIKTYNQMNDEINAGTADYLVIDDVNGGLMQYIYNGTKYSVWHETQLPTSSCESYIYKDSTWIKTSVDSTTDYLPLKGGEMTGAVTGKIEFKPGTGSTKFSYSAIGHETVELAGTNPTHQILVKNNLNQYSSFTINPTGSFMIYRYGKGEGQLPLYNYYAGTASATSLPLESTSMSYSWMYIINGIMASISYNDSDGTLNVNGVSLSSGDTFKLGVSKQYSFTWSVTVASKTLTITPTNITVGDYVSAVLMGM